MIDGVPKKGADFLIKIRNYKRMGAGRQLFVFMPVMPISLPEIIFKPIKI